MNQPTHSLTQYGGRIIVPDAGSSGAPRADIRDNRWGADFQRLRNYRRPHFTTSGHVSEALGERPGIGQPRADSPRDDHGRGVAAWGTPDQKIPDNMDGRPAETWVYLRYETPPSYGGPYYYGPFDWSYIPPKFVHPSRGVTFSNGRVVFFRYLTPP